MKSRPMYPRSSTAIGRKTKKAMARLCFIEVSPQKDFITYGVGIPLMQMRFPEKARGRVTVAPRLGESGLARPHEQLVFIAVCRVAGRMKVSCS